MKALLYYQIRQDRREYLGIRFFRWNPNSGEIIQICVSPGDPKRGKSNNFGIYTITQMTFFSNYLAMQYAVPCSESLYKTAFKKVLDCIK